MVDLLDDDPNKDDDNRKKYTGYRLNLGNNMKQSDRRGAGSKGQGSEPRGAKRKAKHGPYEELHATDDDNDNGDDEVIPAEISTALQRTSQSRMSSSTPGLITRTRPLSLDKRGIARPSIKSNRDDASSTSVATVAAAAPSPSRTNKKAIVAPKRAGARHSHLDSIAPEAHMGDTEVLGHNATSAVSAPATSVPKPAPKVVAEPPQDKGKAKQSEIKSAPAAKRAEEDDEREVKEVVKILRHRMASEPSGAVELLIQWEGEGENDATWEAESEIQQGADEILYEYWRTQGGRINALFHKPKHPPPETYHVFKVLRHERSNRGGFQFEVQWVGHPSTRGETSMETETKLRNVAPKLLATYWESVGGRASFLAPRGRAKKSRTE